MSTINSRPSLAPTLRCRCKASPIWFPTVCTGESEVMGSWNMIDIRPPRIARMASLSGLNAAIFVISDRPARPASHGVGVDIEDFAALDAGRLGQDAHDRLADH